MVMGMLSQQLQDKAAAYVSIHAMMRRGFPMEYALSRLFGALLLVDMEQTPTVEGIRSMRLFMRSETSLFSNFRGTSELMMAVLLYREKNGEQLFARTLQIHAALKQAGFRNGSYLPMTALMLAKNAKDTDLARIIERMKIFYKGMKSRHFWLTGEDDYIHIALLSTTELDPEKALEHMEALYRELSEGGLPKGNGLQSLTHVLTLGEESVQEKCERTEKLHRYLISNQYRLNNYQMAFLGVMTLLSEHPLTLADDALELDDWLKANRGFGNFTVDKKTRFMLAASLIISREVEDCMAEMGNATLSNSIQSILLAQQVATTAAIVAASSAAASTGASS